MEITLFSTSCPKCKILKKKLKEKNIQFTETSDIEELITMGFLEVPVLKIESLGYYTFPAAAKWVNEQGRWVD